PPLYYLGSLLVFTPKLFLAAYKWWYISYKQKMYLSIPYLAKLFLMSLFYASLTPGALGIHVRIYYMRKKTNASLEKCIANSFIDAVSGVIGGIILAVVGSLIYIHLFPGLFPILAVFLVFYGSAFVFFMEKKRGSRFFHILIKPFLPDRYHENLDKIIDLLYEDLPSLPQLILPFLLELVIWTIAATQVYVLAQAFSIPIPYPEFIVISVVSVVVATAIPISIGGLGVREGTFVFLLSQYGVPSEISFVLSLSGFLVKNFIPGVIGLILFFGTQGEETNRFLPKF
ncbi:MAG TPA: flippase-like domain-containing protein, partial [Thermoplasmatales archaeon]|nr:flippase-like domain-containing protein [Thermoplasmatales archaeon]